MEDDRGEFFSALRGDEHAKHRCLGFLSKKGGVRFAGCVRGALDFEPTSDAAVLDMIRRQWLIRREPPRPPKKMRPDADGRERSRVADIMDVLESLREQAWNDGFFYLDVGSAEGRITEAVAEVLGLRKRQAVAVDLSCCRHAGPAQFTFIRADASRLPFLDKTFGLVTMFMSAHHFNDPGAAFAEAFRVSKPGALLLIREHGHGDPSSSLYYDFVHAFYATIAGNETGVRAFAENYAALARQGKRYAYYRPPEEWCALAAAAGFVVHLEPRMPIYRDMFDSIYFVLRRPE
jgi:SAM-dependent methyltransferase